MATVNPTATAIGPDILVTWADMATGDTINPYTIEGTRGVVSCVHFSGTFGGATLGMEHGNNGSSYVAMKDKLGSTIGATSEDVFQLDTAARQVAPTISGGTSDSVTANLILRG